jgi:phosphoribosyl-AMP cyclohydrolase
MRRGRREQRGQIQRLCDDKCCLLEESPLAVSMLWIPLHHSGFSREFSHIRAIAGKCVIMFLNHISMRSGSAPPEKRCSLRPLRLCGDIVSLIMNDDWLDEIKWTADGLVPAIAQDAADGTVLMVAWMNRDALRLTASKGRAVYWSRSRQKLWHKGEESGHEQQVREIRLDCDNDVIMLQVEQRGGIACHTGRRSCFFQRLEDNRWVAVEPVLKDPQAIYRKD